MQTLREFGSTVREIAEHADVSERTVERVSSEGAMTDPAKWEAEARARMGRPNKVRGYEEQIRCWLTAEPKLATVAILQRLRDAGYLGGKSAVYELVRSLRPAKSEGVVRFEAVAGEFSQRDFGTVVVRYEDGTRERIKSFASRLKYSRVLRIFDIPDGSQVSK